jgi:hypothetical protein
MAIRLLFLAVGIAISTHPSMASAGDDVLQLQVLAPGHAPAPGRSSRSRLRFRRRRGPAVHRTAADKRGASLGRALVYVAASTSPRLGSSDGGCGLKSIGEDPDARPVQVVERG